MSSNTDVRGETTCTGKRTTRQDVTITNTKAPSTRIPNIADLTKQTTPRGQLETLPRRRLHGHGHSGHGHSRPGRQVLGDRPRRRGHAVGWGCLDFAAPAPRVPGPGSRIPAAALTTPERRPRRRRRRLTLSGPLRTRAAPAGRALMGSEAQRTRISTPRGQGTRGQPSLG